MKIKTITILLLMLIQSEVNAESMIIFPSDGQSKDQQRLDEGYCYSWAREETGFDPLAPVEEIADALKKRGGALRGAAIGTALGDDHEAAQKGAAAGIIRQGRRNQKAQKTVDAQNQKLAEAQASQMDQFNRANTACLEGKGYVVK